MYQRFGTRDLWCVMTSDGGPRPHWQDVAIWSCSTNSAEGGMDVSHSKILTVDLKQVQNVVSAILHSLPRSESARPHRNMQTCIDRLLLALMNKHNPPAKIEIDWKMTVAWNWHAYMYISLIVVVYTYTHTHRYLYTITFNFSITHCITLFITYYNGMLIILHYYITLYHITEYEIALYCVTYSVLSYFIELYHIKLYYTIV